MIEILLLNVCWYVSKVLFHQNLIFVRFNGYNYDEGSRRFVSKVRFHHGRRCCYIAMAVEIFFGEEETGLKRKLR